MKIKTRVLLLAFVFIFVGSFATLLLSVIPMQGALSDKLNARVDEILRSSSSSVLEPVLAGWEASLSFAQSRSLSEWFKGEEKDQALGAIVQADMINYMEKRGFPVAFAVNEATGHYFIGDKLMSSVSRDNPDTAWFYDSLASGKDSSISIDYNKDLNKTMIWFNMLIRDQDGTPIGIAGIALKLDAFVQSFTMKKPSPNSSLLIVDSLGLIHISTRSDWQGKKLADVLPADMKGVKRYQGQKESGTGLSRIIYTEAPLGTTGLKTILVAPASDYVDSLAKIGLFPFIFTMCWIFLCVLIGLSVLNPAFKSLKLIREEISMIASGEGDLTRAIPVSKDEVGAVAGGMNAFIEKLRVIISSIKDAVGKGVTMNETLHSSTVETSSAVVEIAANTSAITDRMSSMNDTAKQANAAVDGIAAGIENLNDRIREQAAMVEESTAAIVEMKASIASMASSTEKKKHSVGELTELSRASSQTLEEMEHLFTKEVAGKMDDILEMNQVVVSVASQTNLLAMNAAIEAAHAGEAGKGFSVVADEIRKLSEATAESAQNISQAISEIQEGVANTAKSVIETTGNFSKIESEIVETVQTFEEFTHALEEILLGADQILDAMHALNDFTVQVKGSSGEMSVSGKTVRELFTNITRLASEVNSGMGEISIGVSEIRDSMDGVRALNASFVENYRQVASEIERFKV